ncbi:aldehyde dehydrogenase family protein [Streptomyces sp. NBC_00564]|uniref:aldehyde dehydrogenase family protein n=1 Tax=Streptomyces sp. NBC_00564 TaxID=2903663 RepID=UPI00352E89D6|nr:aldehyde dehydrogenase family protein [Streptomyces sp. NBC_00564]
MSERSTGTADPAAAGPASTEPAPGAPLSAVKPPATSPTAKLVSRTRKAVTHNAVILKSAEQTPLSSIALAGALLDAELPELPEWLVQLLPGPGETVGDQLVRHPDVRSITFTGPTAVGRHIRAVSCPARTQLELGSNSPNLLWRDACLDHALPLIVHPAPANGRGRRP